MADHTPGPWAIMDDGVRIYGSKKVGWSDIAEAKRPEDARLIAAAPELPEALRYAEVCIEGVGDIAGAALVLPKVRAAIAKATLQQARAA